MLSWNAARPCLAIAFWMSSATALALLKVGVLTPPKPAANLLTCSQQSVAPRSDPDRRWTTPGTHRSTRYQSPAMCGNWSRFAWSDGHDVAGVYGGDVPRWSGGRLGLARDHMALGARGLAGPVGADARDACAHPHVDGAVPRPPNGSGRRVARCRCRRAPVSAH